MLQPCVSTQDFSWDLHGWYSHVTTCFLYAMPLMNQFSCISYHVGQKHKGENLLLFKSWNLWKILFFQSSQHVSNQIQSSCIWFQLTCKIIKPGHVFASTSFNVFKTIFAIWLLWCMIFNFYVNITELGC